MLFVDYICLYNTRMSHISKPSSTFKERTRTSLNLDGYRANKSFNGSSKTIKDFTQTASTTAPRNTSELNTTHGNFLSKFGKKNSLGFIFNNFSNSDSRSFDSTRNLQNPSDVPSPSTYFNAHRSFDSSKLTRNYGQSQHELSSRTEGLQNEKLYPDVSMSTNNVQSIAPKFSAISHSSVLEPTFGRLSASSGKLSGVASSLPGSMPFEISKERLRSKLLNKTERTKTLLDSFIKKSTSIATIPISSPKTHDKLFGGGFRRVNSSFSLANKDDNSLSNIYADREISKTAENISMRLRMNNEETRFSLNHPNNSLKYDELFGNSQTIKQRKQEQENKLLHHNKFSLLGDAPYANYNTNNDVVVGEEFMPEPYYEHKKLQESNVINKNKPATNNGILTNFVSKLSNLFTNSLNEYNEKLNNYDGNEPRGYTKSQYHDNKYHLNKQDTEELNQIVKKEKKSQKASKLKKKGKKKKKKHNIASHDTDNKNKVKKTEVKDTSDIELKAPGSAASYNTGTSTAVSSKDKPEMGTKTYDSENSTKHQVRRNIFTLNRYKNLDEMKSERKTQLELLLKQKEIDMKDKEIERLNAKINVLEDSIIDVKKSLLEMKMYTTNASLDSSGITGISTPAIPVGSKRRYVSEDEDSDYDANINNNEDKTNMSINKMNKKKRKYDDDNIEETPSKNKMNMSIFKILEHDEDGEANKSAKKIVEDFKRISEKIKRREEELAKNTENTQSSYTNQYSNYDDEFDESNIDETVAQLEKSVSELSPIRIPFRV